MTIESLREFTFLVELVLEFLAGLILIEGYVLTDGVVWYDSQGNVIAPAETEE